MRYNIFSRDSFGILVTVKRRRAVFGLSSASVEAVATNGQVGIPAMIDMTAAATGKIGVSFAAGVLGVGKWDLHVRVTIGSETQTVMACNIIVAAAADVLP